MSNNNDRTDTVVISGARSATDAFWAEATLQVKKAPTSEWETVSKSAGQGQPETITVLPNVASKVIRISFDDLKRFKATHKIGRVIISTGAMTQFDLDVLTPPVR